MARGEGVSVGPNMLSDAVARLLDTYSDAVIDAVNAQSESAARELVRKTKASAPRGRRTRGRYASSIASKLLRSSPTGDTYVWYVKAPNYRLSHLLEKGHKKGKKVGRSGGSTRAFRFIERARSEVAADYERGVRKAIRDAS